MALADITRDVLEEFASFGWHASDKEIDYRNHMIARTKAKWKKWADANRAYLRAREKEPHRKASHAKWRAKNKERLRIQGAAWQAQNRDKVRATARRFYHRNRSNQEWMQARRDCFNRWYQRKKASR